VPLTAGLQLEPDVGAGRAKYRSKICTSRARPAQPACGSRRGTSPGADGCTRPRACAGECPEPGGLRRARPASPQPACSAWLWAKTARAACRSPSSSLATGRGPISMAATTGRTGPAASRRSRDAEHSRPCRGQRDRPAPAAVPSAAVLLEGTITAGDCLAEAASGSGVSSLAG
jgi:hypothetical protein